MNQVEVRVRFVVGETLDPAKDAADRLREAWAIKFLRERGFHIEVPNTNWETPTEFKTRLGICWDGIHRALKRPGCPWALIKYNPRRGKGCARILAILSNPAFDAFVVRYKKKNSS